METNLAKAVRELLAAWDDVGMWPDQFVDRFDRLTDRLRAGVGADNKLVAALHVVRLDPRHRAWMVANDPQCLAQLDSALEQNVVEV